LFVIKKNIKRKKFLLTKITYFLIFKLIEKKIPGVFTKSEPHQTIPNLVVKRFRSNNTERGAFWEDSLMPGNLITKLRNKIGKTRASKLLIFSIPTLCNKKIRTKSFFLLKLVT